MTTYQQYLGKLTIDGTTDDFTVDASAVALTVGEYFIAGYTGEATAQLCEHMQVQIRAISADFNTSTVTYSGSTGLVTIVLNGASGPQAVDITWDDTALGELLGFTGSQTGASTYVATYAPRYVWRPSRPVRLDAKLTQWWTPNSNSRIARGPQGHTFGTKGNLLYEAMPEYLMIDVDECRYDGSSTGWNQLERFFEDVAHAVMPIRCYPDRTQNGSTDYVTAMWAPQGEGGLGSWDGFKERFREDWDERWNVRIPLWKYVTS